MLDKAPYPIRVLAAFALPLVASSTFLSAKTKDAETRLPYAMFEGMDLQVTSDDGVFPIVGFNKKQIIVARNGSRDSVSTKSNISYALRNKLSDKWVDLKILETERFYSQMNSDFAAYSSAVSQLDREQDRSADHALGRRDGLHERNHEGNRRGTTGVGQYESRVGSQSRLNNYEGLSRELEDKFHNPDAYADSLKVILSLDVDELYKGVYLVLIARIDSPGTEPDARPFIQVVGQLKPEKTRKVKVVFKNLPEGFSLLGIDVHAYSQGEEIPHAGSTGLKLMSEEEAFQYSLSQYKEKDGRTEPVLFRSVQAEAISTFMSEKEILRIKADLIVHPDGSTTVDYLNAENTPITEKLVGMLEGVRFVPAMENGQPTEARISLDLSSLVD